MVNRAAERASGLSTAEEVTREESDKADEPIEPQLPEERERSFKTPGFHRMRFNWSGDEARVVKAARDAVDGRVLHNFIDAYQVMHTIYDLVRTAVVDETTSEIKTDKWGFTVWKQTPSGSYEEDWSRITTQERENLLFAITTRLFEWEQRAADAWGEAMFSKAIWEEAFAIGFDKPMSGTVDDRTNYARRDAREERYFAIFLTLYSKKAESVVRTMTLLGQRLRDTLE